MQSISDLVPNEKNPRKITPAQLEGLKKSVGDLGDMSGIVFNVKSKRLVGGHQRVRVLPEDSQIEIVKRYRKATAAGTVAEGHIIVGTERFSYREVNWDPDRERIAMLAANKHGGEWDLEALAEHLQELEKTGADFSLTGFSDDELSKIMEKAGVLEHVESESIKDLKNQWDQSNIRQMVMVMGVEQFEKAMALIEDVKSKEKLETNTDVFMHLLEKWKDEND